MFVFLFSSGSVSRTLRITFWFSSVFSEAPGSWVYVSYARLSKASSYGAASGNIYITNLMGQVPVSHLAIHGQIPVSWRLDGELDKQASQLGSLHLDPGCRRTLLEGPQSHSQLTRQDCLNFQGVALKEEEEVWKVVG